MELNVITVSECTVLLRKQDYLKMEVQLKKCRFCIADRPVLRRGTLNKI